MVKFEAVLTSDPGGGGGTFIPIPDHVAAKLGLRGMPKIQAVIAGVREERFLILPHPAVAKHMALKGAEPERWLAGMCRLVALARAAQEPPKAQGP